MNSAKVRRNKGFLLIRKVIKRNRILSSRPGANQKCLKLLTEDLHPLELFERFNIDSVVDKPVRTSYIPRFRSNSSKLVNASSLNNKKTSREGVLALPTPASGFTSCSDSSFWYYPSYRYTDSNTYALSYYGYAFCAEYANNFGGGFNFNYDTNTQSAATADISIFDGVTCRNCYMYAGATFFVHLEYTSRAFGLEVSLSGATGANVEILVDNPSISGVQTISLLPPDSSWYRITISNTGKNKALFAHQFLCLFWFLYRIFFSIPFLFVLPENTLIISDNNIISNR